MATFDLEANRRYRGYYSDDADDDHDDSLSSTTTSSLCIDHLFLPTFEDNEQTKKGLRLPIDSGLGAPTPATGHLTYSRSTIDPSILPSRNPPRLEGRRDMLLNPTQVNPLQMPPSGNLQRLDERRDSAFNPTTVDPSLIHPVRNLPRIGERRDLLFNPTVVDPTSIPPSRNLTRTEERRDLLLGSTPGGSRLQHAVNGEDMSPYGATTEQQIPPHLHQPQSNQSSVLQDILEDSYREIDDLRRRLRESEAEKVTNRKWETKPKDPDNYTTGGHDRSRKREIKPNKYDGTTPCEDYLIHFDMVAKANDWNGDEKGLQLAAHLAYPASGVLSSLSSSLRQEFNAIRAELLSLYRSGHTEELSRAELRAKQRKPNEALSTLAHDIKKKTRQAYPTASPSVQETIATDQFICALGRGSEISWWVHQSKPKTIKEATNAALDWESWRTPQEQKRVRAIDVKPAVPNVPHDNSINNANISHMMEELTTNMKKLLDDKLKHLTAPATTNTTRKPWQHSQIECYECRQKGHIRRNCPKNTGNTTPNTQQNSPGNC